MFKSGRDLRFGPIQLLQPDGKGFFHGFIQGLGALYFEKKILRNLNFRPGGGDVFEHYLRGFFRR